MTELLPGIEIRPRSTGTRCHITVPGARRTLVGLRPQDAAITCGEHVFRNELADLVRGIVEVTLGFGRADVATPHDVFEVEPWSTWRHGMRQALAYGAMTGLRPNLALFDVPALSSESNVRLKVYARIRDHAPSVRLWFHGPACGWQTITNRHAATRIPR